MCLAHVQRKLLEGENSLFTWLLEVSGGAGSSLPPHRERCSPESRVSAWDKDKEIVLIAKKRVAGFIDVILLFSSPEQAAYARSDVTLFAVRLLDVSHHIRLTSGTNH